MAKLNKEQLKKLYDYGGTLSPKDWADMIDSLVPDENTENTPSVEPGTVIKTTYEEAKALYESGQMIPGVYYKFLYKHYLYKTDHEIAIDPSSISIIEFTNNFNILVYINNNGDLKAKGSYQIEMDEINPEGNIYTFESDYTFKPKYISFDFPYLDDPTYDISEIGYFTTNFITLNITDYDALVDEIINLFPDAYYNSDSSNLYLVIPNSIVYDREEYDSSAEMVVDKITLISQDGVKMDIDVESGRYSINNLNLVHTGCVYNLDYGFCKHSFLYNIYVNYNGTDFSIVNCSCNIFNTEFEPIFSLGSITIHDGDIIDSKLIFNWHDDDFIIPTIYINKLIVEINNFSGDSLILHDEIPYSTVNIDTGNIDPNDN